MAGRIVLGIDLGLQWVTTGSATVSFNDGAWLAVETNVIRWPDGNSNAAAMADAIDLFARQHAVGAVSIDGPQGWRDPESTNAKVGRRCESECATPGKSGEFETSYPKTWLRWVRFSIAVFTELLQRPNVHLANDPSPAPLPALLTDHYYLLECFPTSTWKTAGLKPLPSKRKASTPEVVSKAYARLREAFALPLESYVDDHDEVQAVVAALPAAALLGGPASPVARGIAATTAGVRSGRIEHRVEGLIWDARPKPGVPQFLRSDREAVRASASQQQCPFCKRIESGEFVAENALAHAFPDHFPVSRGHTLVVSRRHVGNFFLLADHERAAMWELAAQVRDQLENEFHPDGYNVGINVGTAGGQTIFHAHVHVIPRYSGDVTDPRGGVRHAVVGRGYYKPQL